MVPASRDTHVLLVPNQPNTGLGDGRWRIRPVVHDDDPNGDALADERRPHRGVEQIAVVPRQDDHVDARRVLVRVLIGADHGARYCTKMPGPASGRPRAAATRAIRLGSSVVTRANLHALLRREPRGFGRLHRDILRSIEGWRYRQDLALLYLLARDVSGEEAILEIGSYRGLSTTALALGVGDRAAGGTVHAVDPHTGDRQDLEQSGVAIKPSEEQFRANLADAGVDRYVTPHVMTSDTLASSWPGSPLRVLFIDGWHSYDAVRRDIENWAPLVTEAGVVLIDDYRNYDEVRQAVDDMANTLPPSGRRAGRMWLAHRAPLPSSVLRLLSIPWG